MNYDGFKELVLSRQACREFSDKPLEREKIEMIVKLAKYSPSACNSQPWKMYVATSKKAVKDVAEALQDSGRNSFLNKAQAFVVFGEKVNTMKEDVLKRYSIDYFMKYDIGEIIAYLTLTAKSLGVESIVIGWVNREKVKKAVSMPDEESATLVVALGYSDSPIREKIRKEDEEVIKII